MIVASTFKGKQVALFGLGGSGLVTAQSLRDAGAELIAWDDNPAQVDKCRQLGIPTGDLRELDWSEIDFLVLAPGVPLTHPKPHWSVDLANDNDVPIIGDVEIFARERAINAPNSSFIAITGTNGKSTTTALIAHILKNAGKDVQMGGNIGTAVLSLDMLSDEKLYVVECSSYQIDLAPSLAPTSGILLNLTPDHLDRHGTMEHYASVKSRLVERSDNAIVSVDDSWCADIADKLESEGVNVQKVSVTNKLENGIYSDSTRLILANDGQEECIIDLDGIETLRGAHNAQNAAAAAFACINAGLSPKEVQAGMNSFTGLKHRMQPVARNGSTLFVNDSKATNAEAAGPALKSFENIFWIVGGLQKDEGIRPLQSLLGRVRRAFIIGEAAPEFAAEMGGKVEFEISELLENAVSSATKAAAEFSAKTGERSVVLFSPACASFDQFKNFEIRGDHFVKYVSATGGIEMLVPTELERCA